MNPQRAIFVLNFIIISKSTTWKIHFWSDIYKFATLFIYLFIKHKRSHMYYKPLALLPFINMICSVENLHCVVLFTFTLFDKALSHSLHIISTIVWKTLFMSVLAFCPHALFLLYLHLSDSSWRNLHPTLEYVHSLLLLKKLHFLKFNSWWPSVCFFNLHFRINSSLHKLYLYFLDFSCMDKICSSSSLLFLNVCSHSLHEINIGCWCFMWFVISSLVWKSM